MAERKSSEPPPAPQAPQVNDFFPQLGDDKSMGTNQHSRFINKRIKNKVLKKLKMRENEFFRLVDLLEHRYKGVMRREPNKQKLQELTYEVLKKNPDAKNIDKFVTIIQKILYLHKTELTQPNLMNNSAIDGQDYLETMLNEISKQEQEKEAQEDQERHNQSPTQEEEDAGLQWSMDGLKLNGGKKKRKTRRKRKKRKTKKRRKNKRKTKKRRKTKRRKTKRRKK